MILISLLPHAQVGVKKLNSQDSARHWKVGELNFTYKGSDYDAFIFDPARHSLKMHWKSDAGTTYRNLGDLKKNLDKSGADVLMLTNAGMYQVDNSPLGLFISEGKILRRIITRTNSEGNFYLQPNGVFYVNEKGRCYIKTTTDYISDSPKQQVRFATQSGPMLVFNGTINKSFKEGSQNINLRSGVGILPGGQVVFVISRSYTTNFFDFASMFKEKFECKDALFLDGAISRMYLKRSRPSDLDGDFGAIISVTLKK